MFGLDLSPNRSALEDARDMRARAAQTLPADVDPLSQTLQPMPMRAAAGQPRQGAAPFTNPLQVGASAFSGLVDALMAARQRDQGGGGLPGTEPAMPAQSTGLFGGSWPSLLGDSFGNMFQAPTANQDSTPWQS